MFDIRGGHFRVFDSVIFPLTSLLSSLYWPWDPLSSLESTPVSIKVPKQVDCNMCRFSKLLLFSFFFCKDGSDRLMKQASYPCCNFLCIVLAAAYLKCRLSCLPFVWHFFFSLWHTHTHAHIQTLWLFTIHNLCKVFKTSWKYSLAIHGPCRRGCMYLFERPDVAVESCPSGLPVQGGRVVRCILWFFLCHLPQPTSVKLIRWSWKHRSTGRHAMWRHHNGCVEERMTVSPQASCWGRQVLEKPCLTSSIMSNRRTVSPTEPQLVVSCGISAWTQLGVVDEAWCLTSCLFSCRVFVKVTRVEAKRFSSPPCKCASPEQGLRRSLGLARLVSAKFAWTLCRVGPWPCWQPSWCRLKRTQGQALHSTTSTLPESSRQDQSRRMRTEDVMPPSRPETSVPSENQRNKTKKLKRHVSWLVFNCHRNISVNHTVTVTMRLVMCNVLCMHNFLQRNLFLQPNLPLWQQEQCRPKQIFPNSHQNVVKNKSESQHSRSTSNGKDKGKRVFGRNGETHKRPSQESNQ